ncbi:MAG: branched-chain amino acid ABC transporter substrate-binding protein [Planctomycetes bacterium]|nr:branched-chain amino acid ABC transporter substrate-binding protein [Planctomycetota bacterium]
MVPAPEAAKPAAPAPEAAKPAAPVRGTVIKIFSSLPRTGSAKAQTDTIVNGIKMAIDENGGQVAGFTLLYQDLDDATAAAGKWTQDAEIRNAQQAIDDPDVMVYIGTYNSGAAKVSMPMLNNADILMISPANTWPGLTKPGAGDPGEPDIYRPKKKINYCRVVPADDLQGPLGADWAKEMNVGKVYILDDTEVYGKGIATLFKERCQEIDIEVLGHESIAANKQEFRSLMTKIKGTNPDLVYFGGTSQSKGGQVASDMVSVGLTCKLMVPDGCREQAFIEAAGKENLEGRCYVTFGGLPPDQQKGRGKAFVDRYVKKHGGMPDAYAIYGYEAAQVAVEAIRRAGKKDRDAIRAAGVSIKDFDGALGKWSFDANGDTTLKTMSGSVVKGGEFVFVKILGGE